ncbi:CHAT domain-containing protein [Hoeflea olei]|uniref:CHAT domain-containing protein n=1 Tax=Hoeflea olei TaxID=1480615 RepID=A0A1C1Z146_9HYPH|nr:CHAT domain-containing protein [Hoeflea olei]OCW59478.1 hypothetical protein AWJ14_10685 [Hoeflea olei]
MIARLVFLLLLLLPVAGPVQALEIYRNSVRYDIVARLPGGAQYIVDGVDRKFSLPGVSGNLRLIQDDYASCAQLVDERRQNWVKYGFTLSYGRYVSRSECSITIESPDENRAISSYYIRVDRCGCFAALHLSYAADDRGRFMQAAPEILGSLRANNSGAAGPDYPEPPDTPVADTEEMAPAEAAQTAAAPATVAADSPASAPLATRELPPGEGLKRMTKALASFSCHQPGSTDDQRQAAIIALSGWAGKSIRTLGREAGLAGFADMLEQNYDFASLGPRGAEAIDGVLAAHPDLIDAVERDAAAYGDRLCQILGVSLQDNLPDLARRQAEFRSVYHGSLIAAQRLMALHRCADGEIDGAFGPGSRANWNRMLAGLGLPPRDDSYTPGIGDLARVADIKVTAGACEADSGAYKLAVSPLRFLADPGLDQRSTWLEIRDADLASSINAMAQAGEWSPWQTRLALRLFPHGYGDNDDEPQRMLAALFANGVGVDADPAAAAHWRAKANQGQSAYSLYLAALADPARVPDAVRALLADANFADTDYGEQVPAGPLSVPYGAQISLLEYPALARLSTLVMRAPAALDQVARTAKPALLYKLAERLLEGASIDGKGSPQAVALLEAAADRGAAYAASRLAFMVQHGLGTKPDPDRARTLAQTAARDGDTFALYQLARQADDRSAEDAGAALAAYERLLKALAAKSNFALSGLLSNRIMEGSIALTSVDGEKLLGKYGLNDGSIYMCTDCGGVVDLAEAARLLRQTHPDVVEFDRKDKNFDLFRLISDHPELAKSKDEPERLLAAGILPAEDWIDAPFGSQSDVRSILAAAILTARRMGREADLPEAMTALLDQICGNQSIREYFCTDAARRLASGQFGAALVGPGIARLQAENSFFLIDVLAAFGDFRGALDRGLKDEKEQGFEFRASLLTRAAAPVFRRVMAQRSRADMATLPEGFEDLLRFHARHNDIAARQYLELLEDPGTAKGATPKRDLGETSAAFERAAARGGLSRALVNAAREYSAALEETGDRAAALRLELTALAAELQLDDLDALGRKAYGAAPLDATLTAVCHLSKASERAFALGADRLALVLAKDTINQLQTLRGGLSGMPERLQGCFRDLVSDNYRWLADLLVSQNRLGEAQVVLGLLKDYETFQFTGRDGEFAGQAFAQLPYSPEEQALKTALSALAPPTIPQARRAAQLAAQAALKKLTAEQARERTAIEDTLAEARQAHQSGIDAILAAAGAITETGEAGFQAALGVADAYVENTPGEQAAVLHYLVLPDRLSIILTTHDNRVSRTITDWNGTPFREADLNAAIDRLHASLSDPDLDPLPGSRTLYDLLVKPVAADLRSAGTQLLLLSLDKRLRYLPFAALHDGTKFLVEDYETSILTNSGHEISGSKVTGAPFAALGMTQETESFSALPGVAIELDGIVKGEDGFGLFDGSVRMDDAFDRPALAAALQIGEPTPAGVGVVHVSSHFALGETDQDSFLLLGTGDYLTLRDIKLAKTEFDFEHVELLTLSACTTGFANPGRDGREIDSLAKITSDRGAKSTLASLWPVADSATAILMQRFYELRELGQMSKAQALATAQREFIGGLIGSPDHLRTRSVVFQTAVRTGESFQERQTGIDLGFSHPFFWAPFVLTGNWR